MVKILHMSDTHVSHRRSRDVRDSWKIQNKIGWIENDFGQSFKETIGIAAKGNYDYVVHAGDLFDIPVGRNISSPSEVSRALVISEIHKFILKTEGKVPFIIIDGNHGTYFTKDNSTLEYLQAAFPDVVYIATNMQIKQAIMNNEPLKIEFDNVIFYLFPYFKFGVVESHSKAYEEWLRNNQQPDDGKIAIAIAHGMDVGVDLHEYVLQYSYDYVALGHDHHQKQRKKNAWFSGSTSKYTFAEIKHEKCVLEVEIEKNSTPVVNPIKLIPRREMKQFDLSLKSDINEVDFENKIREHLHSYKKKFDGNTAIRLKFKFSGNVLLTNWWRMEDTLLELQKECFSDNYNILELRWDAGNIVKQAPPSMIKSAKFHEFLIENPVKDFERYIRSKTIAETDLAQVLIQTGAEIIKEVFGDAATITETSEEEEEK